MRNRRWIEAVNLGTTKRQFSHQLVYKLMKAINRLHRSHNWSWARRDFIFTTQPRFVSSEETWAGAVGDNFITVGAGLGDVGSEYTGCEIEISSGGKSTRSRIVRIGDRDDNTYAIDKIWIDQHLQIAHSNAKITVFRREYAPRSRDSLVVENFTGDLRKRGDSTILVNLDKIEIHRNWSDIDINTTSADPSNYIVLNNEKIPAPRFAPVVTGNNTNGSKTPPSVGSDLYLACAYRDPKSGLMGPIGPIVKHSIAGGLAAGYSLEVEYGNESGVPEESYELMLLSSPFDPVGFDGKEPADKDFRINESMIPFSIYGSHPRSASTYGAGTKGGGRFQDVGMDEDLFIGQRWWPWNEQCIIRFREVPTSSRDYVIPGKARHPWMNYVDDEPLVPDEMQDAVELAIRSSIQGQDGLLAERRFQFTIRVLRQKDSRKATTTTPLYERFGQRRIVDRYDLG